MHPILLTVSLVISCFSIGAFAADHSDSSSNLKKGVTQLKKDCKNDVQRLCNDITPGEGRIISCLDSKSDKLSERCKNSLTEANEKVSKKMDQAEISFRKNCGSDVQKFCSEVPSGRGRLMSCLGEHENQVSNSCKQFQAKVHQKVERLLG
jgi:Cysteine rich repeat